MAEGLVGLDAVERAGSDQQGPLPALHRPGRTWEASSGAIACISWADVVSRGGGDLSGSVLYEP